MRFSDRLPPRTDANAISRAVDDLNSRGVPVVDLTESNPTRVGLSYPADLLAGLADPAGLTYQPHPLGLRTAREAVARDCSRRGVTVDPDTIVLSASTSESYSWLFKLLCNPGDSVAIPQPSYPLFEHLTRLEGVSTFPYALSYHGRWEIDFHSLAAAPTATRAVLLVSPNNPTGSFISPRDFREMTLMCQQRGWALIADEVFADYALDNPEPLTDLATHADVLTFTLGGASKSIGLPQLKLGWTMVGGPPRIRDAALSALELIADTFLSVGTPVQLAAAGLLERGADLRAAIHTRVRNNLSRARDLVRRYPSCDLLPVEGGWTAPLRVPASRSEDTLVLALLQHEGILVHPGYFFDFPHEAFLVFSLLPEEHRYADALERVLQFVQA